MRVCRAAVQRRTVEREMYVLKPYSPISMISLLRRYYCTQPLAFDGQGM